MSDYITRMRKELTALDEKIENMANFVNSDAAKTVPPEEIKLIAEQAIYMTMTPEQLEARLRLVELRTKENNND